MNIDQLYEFAENASIDETKRQKIALLIEAINDWPVEVQTTDAFFRDVKNFLKIDVLTYQAINAKMKGLDPKDYAWQLEALTSLVQIERQNTRQHYWENRITERTRVRRKKSIIVVMQLGQQSNHQTIKQ